jgi:hypothetical protein
MFDCGIHVGDESQLDLVLVRHFSCLDEPEVQKGRVKVGGTNLYIEIVMLLACATHRFAPLLGIVSTYWRSDTTDEATQMDVLEEEKIVAELRRILGRVLAKTRSGDENATVS